jgi:outer membrane protein OmpA-like peptidoglycan-associated protein/tetratricopeptide (TPR) repeat protein
MKTLYSLLILLMIGLLANPLAAQNRKDLQLQMDAAQSFMNLGDYEKALYQYHTVFMVDNTMKNGNKELVALCIAVCYNKLGSYSVSSEWANKAVANPEANKRTRSGAEELVSSNAHLSSSDSHIDYLSAENLLDRQNILKARTLIAEASAFYDQKNYKKALALFEEAKKLRTTFKIEDARFLYMMGDCYINTDESDESLTKAIAVLLKSNELNPKLDLFVPFELGLCYAILGDLESAIKWYNYGKSAFSLNPKQIAVFDKQLDELLPQVDQINAGKALKKTPVSVKITNLGANINSDQDDYFPSVTADETMLLFTSRRPGSTGGKSADGTYDEDLWFSEMQADSSWGPVKNFGTPVNTPNNNAIASFTGDGQYVVCVRCGETGGYGSCDLYGATLHGKIWSEPINLGSAINSKEWDSQVSISADGKTLVFASKREGGLGSSDLWMSRKDSNQRWHSPVNLGSKINTSGSEDSPFLHPDGKTLYFSSNNLSPRLGGYDIYKTTQQPDGSWSTPENLGFPINSEKNDEHFVLAPSGLTGYFTSDRAGGYGKDDLYKVTYPAEKRTSLTTLVGFVMDGESKTPAGSSIRIEDIESGELTGVYASNESTGKFVVILRPGHNYSITVNKKGYLFYSENFNIPVETSFKEIRKEIFLQQIKTGNKIVLNNIFFDSGKSTLRSESESEIKKLCQLLQENSAIKVEISGHTDNVGNDEANRLLSQERAQVVTAALIAKGIAASRILIKGYGKTQPVASNDTEDGRQLNRRTEFKVL